jgi:hypothetical protein
MKARADRVVFVEFENGVRVMLPGYINKEGKAIVLPAWPVDGIATEQEYIVAMMAANGGAVSVLSAKLDMDDGIASSWPVWAKPIDWTRRRKLDKDSLIAHKNTIKMLRNVEEIAYNLR